MEKEELIIVGAGASGMMAALAAAEAGVNVLILEKMDKPGKKLLATGNGKCNFTNRYQDMSCYHGSDEGFIRDALQEFSYQETLRAFRDIGIWHRERDGYVYPMSEQASAVADALIRRLNDLRVRIRTGETVRRAWRESPSGKGAVRRFRKDGDPGGEGRQKQGKESPWIERTAGYVIKTEQKEYRTDQVILAPGGAASPVHGTSGDGYALAGSLGLKLSEPVPALTSLVLKGSFMKGWAGVRVRGRVSLYSGTGALLSEDQGELQMVEHGLSGIPVFQVSRYAARAISQGDAPYLLMDLFPEQTEEALMQGLQAMQEALGRWTAADALNGLIHKKLAKVLLKSIGADPGSPIRKWTEEEMSRIAGQMKHWRLDIQKTGGFEKAQVTAGGVLTEQIDPATMEARGMPGLYITGELLDVDGICGGYNLQWAWTSGSLAGRAAARNVLSNSDDGA